MLRELLLAIGIPLLLLLLAVLTMEQWRDQLPAWLLGRSLNLINDLANLTRRFCW
jgi:hypothetical protein